MRRFLFASHGYLAKGVYSALELIVGESEQVEVLSAYTEEDYDIQQEIAKHLQALPEEDELIIITDMFGGSVNNEFMTVIEKTEKALYLIAGLHLSLAMSLVMKREDPRPTDVIIEEAIEESKGMICYCNRKINENKEQEDEEF